MSAVITVSIIEDQKDISNILTSYIERAQNLQFIQHYNNGQSAIHFLPKNPVDVVVVDLGLPDIDGSQCIEQLREQCPDLCYLVYTVFEDSDLLFQALKSGAHGYLLKGASEAELVSAIEEVYHGGSPMSPKIARKVIEYFSVSQKRTIHSIRLTEKESSILELLSKGYYYKEIAAEQHITIGTVKQRLNRLYRKLHVQNRNEAVEKYRQG